MGVAYIVNNQPVFLTFEKYNFLLNLMNENGIFSEEERNFVPIAVNRICKKQENIDKKIIDFLSSNISNYYSEFDLEGKEAQEEILTLLYAYRWAYGGFDFYRFATILGDFVPYEYALADLNYPYGKMFYITRVCEKRFFKKKKVPLIHILIDTNKVIHIKGNLLTFVVELLNDSKLLFFQNQFCVI